MKTAQGIRLLEERVRRAVWRREQNDAPGPGGCVRRDSREDRRSGGRLRGPNEEYRGDILECRIERRWDGEVARHDLDAGRQRRVFRPPRKRAHAHAGAQKLVDQKAPNPAGGARHENRAPRRVCHL